MNYDFIAQIYEGIAKNLETVAILLEGIADTQSLQEIIDIFDDSIGEELKYDEYAPETEDLSDSRRNALIFFNWIVREIQAGNYNLERDEEKTIKGTTRYYIERFQSDRTPIWEPQISQVKKKRKLTVAEQMMKKARVNMDSDQKSGQGVYTVKVKIPSKKQED